MIGTWNVEVNDNVKGMLKGVETKASFEFKDEKAVSMHQSFGGNKVDFEGTYVLKDKALTITVDTKSVPGGTALPPMNFTLADDMKSFEIPQQGRAVKQ